MQKKIVLLTFIILASVYFLTASGYLEKIDTYFSVHTAKSIVENHSLSIEPINLEEEIGFLYRTNDGKYYSQFGIGLSFLFIPYILAGKTIASLTGLPEYRIIFFIISFYNVFFGAGVCLVMFYLIKFFNTSAKTALSVTFILGLATMCWRYSVIDFSEVSQMFFLLLTIYSVLKNTRKSLFIGSLSYTFLLLLKIVNIIYLPAFILYILLKNGLFNKENPKRIFNFIFLTLIGIGFVFFLNFIRFGDIFEFGYGDRMKFNLSGLDNIKYLLFSPHKGIFIYNPILLLSVFGYFKFCKLFKKESIFFLSIIVLNLCVFSMWCAWWGGSCWGPRFLVPVIPLWLLPIFYFFNKKTFVKWLVIPLFFISFLIQLISVLQTENEYHAIKLKVSRQESENPVKLPYIGPVMPPDIVGSVITLKHRIFKKNNIYNLSEFGIDSDTIVDISEYGAYRCLTLWYCHLARYFNKPIIKYIPFALLPFIGIYVICLLKTVNKLDRTVL